MTSLRYHEAVLTSHGRTTLGQLPDEPPCIRRKRIASADHEDDNYA